MGPPEATGPICVLRPHRSGRALQNTQTQINHSTHSIDSKMQETQKQITNKKTWGSQPTGNPYNRLLRLQTPLRKLQPAQTDLLRGSLSDPVQRLIQLPEPGRHGPADIDRRRRCQARRGTAVVAIGRMFSTGSAAPCRRRRQRASPPCAGRAVEEAASCSSACLCQA